MATETGRFTRGGPQNIDDDGQPTTNLVRTGKRVNGQPVRTGAIDRTLVQRLGAAMSGFVGGWFGPQEPLNPVAPASTTGRRFDYPYGVNLNYTPRGETGGLGAPASIPFETLRRFADPAQGGLDILRLAIETRKDQMAAQKWTIKGRTPTDDGGPVARALEAMLRKPDGSNTFRQWSRQLLEDHFVIDAPAIYFRPTDSLPLLEVMDGATLKLLIDDRGRTPLPPLPAYQQVLKGMPAVDYTTKELGYYMYNPRTNRIYGQSRVEQVLGIATIALNRQLSVLSYYTSGTVPDAFAFAPEAWTPDQIEQAQEYMDSIMTGDVAEKRKLRILPGMTIHETKTEILKNEFDEWLARIICYCFSLPPLALVKETNRATAQTSANTSAEEGIEPTKLWFKDVMDDILLRIGAVDLEWSWQDEEIQNPETKAKVIATYTGNRPVIGLDEARKMIGIQPADAATLAQLAPLWAAPAKPDAFGTSDDDPDEADKFRKARQRGRSLRPLPQETKRVRSVRKQLRELVAGVLETQSARIIATVTGDASKLAKAGPSELSALIHEILASAWDDDARERLWTLLAELSEGYSVMAMEQIAAHTGSQLYEITLTQANEHAVEWARFRASNLIVDVNETTRQLVNEITAHVVQDGLSNQQFADIIEDSFGFSEDRAMLIARTETAEAQSHGALEGYKMSGVVTGKEWSSDGEACDECAALGGEVVGLDETFSSGDDGPPAHPSCRCSLLPVVPDLDD